MGRINLAGYVVLSGTGKVIGLCVTEKAAKRKAKLQAVTDPGARYTDTWFSDDDYFKEIHGRDSERSDDGANDGDESSGAGG